MPSTLAHCKSLHHALPSFLLDSDHLSFVPQSWLLHWDIPQPFVLCLFYFLIKLIYHPWKIFNFLCPICSNFPWSWCLVLQYKNERPHSYQLHTALCLHLYYSYSPSRRKMYALSFSFLSFLDKHSVGLELTYITKDQSSTSTSQALRLLPTPCI